MESNFRPPEKGLRFSLTEASRPTTPPSRPLSALSVASQSAVIPDPKGGFSQNTSVANLGAKLPGEPTSRRNSFLETPGDNARILALTGPTGSRGNIKDGASIDASVRSAATTGKSRRSPSEQGDWSISKIAMSDRLLTEKAAETRTFVKVREKFQALVKDILLLDPAEMMQAHPTQSKSHPDTASMRSRQSSESSNSSSRRSSEIFTRAGSPDDFKSKFSLWAEVDEAKKGLAEAAGPARALAEKLYKGGPAWANGFRDKVAELVETAMEGVLEQVFNLFQMCVGHEETIVTLGEDVVKLRNLATVLRKRLINSQARVQQDDGVMDFQRQQLHRRDEVVGDMRNQFNHAVHFVRREMVELATEQIQHLEKNIAIYREQIQQLQDEQRALQERLEKIEALRKDEARVMLEIKQWVQKYGRKTVGDLMRTINHDAAPQDHPRSWMEHTWGVGRVLLWLFSNTPNTKQVTSWLCADVAPELSQYLKANPRANTDQPAIARQNVVNVFSFEVPKIWALQTQDLTDVRKEMHLTNAHHLIMSAYLDKIEADAAAIRDGRLLEPLPSFIFLHLMSVYHHLPVARKHLGELIVCVHNGSRRFARLRVFSRFCGMAGEDNLPLDALIFFLHCLSRIRDELSRRRSGDSDALPDESPPEDGVSTGPKLLLEDRAGLRLAEVHRVVAVAIPNLSPQLLQSMNVRAQKLFDPAKSTVDADELLEMLLEEWCGLPTASVVQSRVRKVWDSLHLGPSSTNTTTPALSFPLFSMALQVLAPHVQHWEHVRAFLECIELANSENLSPETLAICVRQLSLSSPQQEPEEDSTQCERLKEAWKSELQQLAAQLATLEEELPRDDTYLVHAKLAAATFNALLNGATDVPGLLNAKRFYAHFVDKAIRLLQAQSRFM